MQKLDPFIARTFSSLFGSIPGGEQNFRKIPKSIPNVLGYYCYDSKSWVFSVELLKESLGEGVFGKKIVESGHSDFYGDHIKAVSFRLFWITSKSIILDFKLKSTSNENSRKLFSAEINGVVVNHIFQAGSFPNPKCYTTITPLAEGQNALLQALFDFNIWFESTMINFYGI